MAKGYWVAFADVTDPDGYKGYMAANAVPFRKYGGRFLVRSGTGEFPESRARTRTIVIEFPSHQAAVDCYRSPEYQAAIALRQGKGVVELAIVAGYDGPQPGDG